MTNPISIALTPDGGSSLVGGGRLGATEVRVPSEYLRLWRLDGKPAATNTKAAIKLDFPAILRS